MIEWVDDAFRAWGLQKRRIYFGGFFAGEHFHHDGHAKRSVAAKIYEEREGASESALRQHWEEVLTGEALMVSRTLPGIPEHWHWMAIYRYVVPNKIVDPKTKKLWLREAFPEKFKARDDYYDHLHSLHTWVTARWREVPHGTDRLDTVATL